MMEQTIQAGTVTAICISEKRGTQKKTLDTARLRTDFGDVSRFTHKGALTAFAGVDPGVNESVTYEQKSVPTSKRGSSDLRKTLFQVMDALIKTKPQDDPVYQFLDKKRAQGKPYYVYMTAGANKFLRIYYGRVKEYLSSLSES